MNDMDGKVIFINGSIKGIGTEEVKAFVWEGAKVVIGDVCDKEGKQLTKRLGNNARFIHLDVADPKSWEEAVKITEKEFGYIDVLINNSNVGNYVAFEDYSLEQFRQILDINLIGHFNGMKAVVPSMKNAGRGSIINISSTIGAEGHPFLSGYAASKWAIQGLTKNVAMELNQYNIRVNSVHAGNTNIFTEEINKSGKIQVSLKKGGKGKEIIDAILFFASNESSFITGTEILINGQDNVKQFYQKKRTAM